MHTTPNRKMYYHSYYKVHNNVTQMYHVHCPTEILHCFCDNFGKCGSIIISSLNCLAGFKRREKHKGIGIGLEKGKRKKGRKRGKNF